MSFSHKKDTSYIFKKKQLRKEKDKKYSRIFREKEKENTKLKDEIIDKQKKQLEYLIYISKKKFDNEEFEKFEEKNKIIDEQNEKIKFLTHVLENKISYEDFKTTFNNLEKRFEKIVQENTHLRNINVSLQAELLLSYPFSI